MQIRSIAALAAFAVACAGPAFAAERVVANLEQPVAAKIKVVAGGAVWKCEGSTCVASASSSRSTSVRACQDLSKEVGRLSAFGGRASFDAEALGRCNGSAAELPATQQAAK